MDRKATEIDVMNYIKFGRINLMAMFFCRILQEHFASVKEFCLILFPLNWIFANH